MRGKTWVSIIFKTLPLVVIVCAWALVQYGVPLLAAGTITVSANPQTIGPNGSSAISGDNGSATDTIILSISPANLGTFASCNCTSYQLNNPNNSNPFFSFSDNFVSNGTPGTATITASDYFGKVTSGTTSVTIVQPTLSVTPTFLTFNTVAGQVAHSVQTGQVTLSATNGTVNYTSSIGYNNGEPTGWLSVSPASSSVAPGQPLPVTVTANNSNLPAGTFTARITFNNPGNPTNNTRLTVTFNNAAPPTATNTPAPPTATNTPVPPTATNTPAPPTATNTPILTTAVGRTTATTLQASGTITISGKVTVNGVGASGLTVRLNGGNYRQTDSGGNYSFVNLQAGRYQPVLLVDPTKYTSLDGYPRATDVDGYVYAVIPVSDNQNVTGINFNLATATTATTTVATTTVATSTTVTTVAETPTPVATTASGLPPAPTPTFTPTPNSDFAGCQPPAPLANVLSFNYCTTQSPTDPNQFRVDVLVFNATNLNIDLSNTLIFNLQAGTQTRKPAVSTGKVSVSGDGSQLIWSGFQLPPGQPATLSFFISKAAGSVGLINSIKVTGVNLVTGSPFSAILPSIQAQAGRGQSPIYPIGGSGNGNGNGNGNGTPSRGQGGVSNTPAPSLPNTGTRQSIQTATPDFLALLSIGLGLALGGGCIFGVVWQLRRRR